MTKATPLLTPLEQNLTRLAELKVKIDEAKAARQEFDELKNAVAIELMATQSDKTKPTAGIYALISRKTVPYVTDEEAVSHWFIQHDYPDRDFMTDPMLDMAKISKIAQEVLEADGELITGLEHRTVETLSVRSVRATK